MARVAGLVLTGYPGAPKSTRQLQASAGLFYDVLGPHEPAKRLLAQAAAEVLAQEPDLVQLRACLARRRQWRVESVLLRAPSPLALALMVERFREQLSTEQLADRLARIVADADADADACLPACLPGRRSRGDRPAAVVIEAAKPAGDPMTVDAGRSLAQRCHRGLAVWPR